MLITSIDFHAWRSNAIRVPSGRRAVFGENGPKCRARGDREAGGGNDVPASAFRLETHFRLPMVENVSTSQGPMNAAKADPILFGIDFRAGFCTVESLVIPAKVKIMLPCTACCCCMLPRGKYVFFTAGVLHNHSAKALFIFGEQNFTIRTRLRALLAD